ncbi:MAG: hypothetical protein ACI4VJ_02705 [Methanosphaera sp.]|jgi:hypothetical protein|uniref:hypothetical protein n=1 Tax=Methanosphaera TaxID=2316 RepID=UPI0023805000|nr:hypothetical protein [Candidatus Methanosphaera massiliense]MDD6285540.1 hypothetical protein [Methanobacteriaceae archaeon]MDE4078574.1 hypothetical protein [Candidatus Methanosphaera massiliense]MDY2744862.1 hypothetical protein [Methanosphaera sp.]
MNKFDIDGKKIEEDQNNYLKETFDLPEFTGDYEDIYFYLVGFYTKTIVNITNPDKIDPLLIDAFQRASDENDLVSVNIEE